MKTVYIAAPFAAPTEEERAENVRRAERLAAIAIERGLAPVVLHRAIAAGVYGDDNDPAARAKGLAMAKAIAMACDEFWVLLQDDGGLSSGCIQEFEAWEKSTQDGDTFELARGFLPKDLSNPPITDSPVILLEVPR